MSVETEGCKEISDLIDVSVNENCLVTGLFKDLSKVVGDDNGAVPKVVSMEHGGEGVTDRKCSLMEYDDPDGSYDFRSCGNSVNGVSIDKTLLMEEDPKSEDGCLNHDKKVQVQELSFENAEAACQESKIDYEANVGPVVLSVKPVNDVNQTAVIDTALDEPNAVIDSSVNTLQSLDEPGKLENEENNLEEPRKKDDYQNSQESGLEVYLSEEVAKSFPFVPEEDVPILSSSNEENETSPLSSLSDLLENEDGALKLEYEIENSSTSGNGDHLDTDDRSVYEDQPVNDGANTANMKIPFNYLIKVPRYDDESLRQQIEHTEQEFEESTRFRDLIKAGIKIIKAKSQELHALFESAKSEEKLAWDLIKSKRQEIEAVESAINRVKNAITVDDLDIRIHWMEQMIEHRTLVQKEETYYLREIKQLKTIREWLYSSMGSEEEVQQAFSQNDGAEERLMILRKELNQLKNNFADAEEAAKVAWWKYDDERRKMKGLYVMFTTEDDVCQEEFRHLKSLQNQLRDKNVWFMRYKDEESFANEFPASGDDEVLHPFCMNQVDGIMEEWNQNDEFRTIYIRSNSRSTLKRFRTLDGRELGQDEEESFVEADNNAMYISVDHSMSITPTKEENNNSEALIKKRTYEMQLSEPIVDDESAKPQEMNEEMVAKNEEEEEEKMRLKEQQRKQEEMEKAKEALERKRRNVERAMARAEVWAQKEAEQKEKKKARKKDKKKECETEGEVDDDDDNKEGEGEIRKRFQFGKKKKNSKTKSIPPPASILRNKGKKRIEQWISAVILIVVVLVLFLLGNIGIYSNLKSRSFNNQHHI